MDINYWAVIVSAVASMVIGGLWYGPLFGKIFIKAQGWDKRSKEEQKEMMKGMVLNYIWQFLASCFMFCALSIMIYSLAIQVNAIGGMEIALFLWLGIIVPMKFGDNLWGGKSVLFWLGIGNTLITFLVAGAIIGGWR